MNFSSPIPRAVQPRFNEGSQLASVRDDRNNSKQWQKNKIVKNQQSSDGGVLANLQRHVAQLRKRQVGYMPQVFQPFPFAIYNIENTEVIGGKRNPKLDPYTFQIRSGIIGARSYLTVGSFDVPSNGNRYSANFESLIYCFNTDGLGNIGFSGLPGGSSGSFYDPASPNTYGNSNVTLSNLADTLITGLKDGILHSQVVLDQTPDYYGDCLGSFWIELVDDADLGIFPNLMGRMWTFDSFSFRPQDPFPTGSNIIPIGVCNRHVYSPADVRGEYIQVSQYISGNLICRYPPNVQIFRGKWVTDLLSGKVFYPNDLVLDDSAAYITKNITGGGGGSFTYQRQYIFIGASPAIKSIAPHSDSANWRPVAANL